MWFSGLGFGAYQLAPLLSSPRAWRIIEVLVAITMFIMAGMLVTSSI
ncbi:LysE family transporter [Corynebacterium glaucum]|nr:LysE family transporter [Corynebacterium glaucum]